MRDCRLGQMRRSPEKAPDSGPAKLENSMYKMQYFPTQRWHPNTVDVLAYLLQFGNLDLHHLH
jgi:hypothetical protein